MAVILAKWDSDCASAACGFDRSIEEGDEIGYYDDAVMHRECAETEASIGATVEFMDMDMDSAPRPVAHCDTCWCPKPCFCDPEGN